MAELKPCPFCGSKKIFMNTSPDVYCYCAECGTEGPWFWGNEENPWKEEPTETLEEFAERAWNRRAEE